MSNMTQGESYPLQSIPPRFPFLDGDTHVLKFPWDEDNLEARADGSLPMVSLTDIIRQVVRDELRIGRED